MVYKTFVKAGKMPYIVLLRKVEFGEVGDIVGILQVASVVFESAVVLFFPRTMLWLPIMNKEVPDILVTAGIDLSQELQFSLILVIVFLPHFSR